METNNIEIIERLLDDKLDIVEREELNLRLVYDEKFRILYEKMRIMISAIRYSARNSTFEEKLENLNGSWLS